MRLPLLSRRALPLVVAMVLAGCAGPLPTPGSVVTQQAFSYEDTLFPISHSFQTTNASGAAMFRVSSTINASIVYTFSYQWDRTRLNPLEIVYIEETGVVRAAPIITEYPFGQNDLGSPTGMTMYAGVAGQEVETPPPGEDTETMAGAFGWFSEAKEAVLVVMWANLESPVRLDLFFLDGTLVENDLQTSDVAAITAREMRGGIARFGSPIAGGSLQDAYSFGPPGQDILIIVKVKPIYGEGELVVDAGERRIIPLGIREEARPMRYIFTAEGEARFSLLSAGADDLQVAMVMASVPKGTLPTFTYERDEPY